VPGRIRNDGDVHLVSVNGKIYSQIGRRIKAEALVRCLGYVAD
jgi:hypothetical protein